MIAQAAMNNVLEVGNVGLEPPSVPPVKPLVEPPEV